MSGPTRTRSPLRRVVWLAGFLFTALAVARWLGAQRLQAGFEDALTARDTLRAERRELAPGEAPTDSLVRLRVVSYNAWALPIWLPGTERPDRLPRIVPALASHGADVVAFQEAFHVDFRRFARDYLSGYHAGPGADCFEPLAVVAAKDCTGGLLTLSRWPVTSEAFHAHALGPGAKWDERRGRKGFLLTAIDTPLGALLVVNVHLYAGRDSAHEEERVRQVRRLGEAVREAAGEAPVLLIGDLNVVHPSLAGDSLPSSTAFRLLVDSLGFVDTFERAREPGYTYDVRDNRFAGLWYNRFEGRQIFDYVMVRSSARSEVRATAARRVLHEEPLSDHYGLVVDLVLRGIPDPHG